MLLTAFIINTQKVGTELIQWDGSDLGGNPAFKAEATVSTGYGDITSLANWNTWWKGTLLDYKELRNELIAVFLPNWATLGNADKKILLTHYIWPSTETTVNLDLLYTQAERDAFQEIMMGLLDKCDCLIRKSNVIGSIKYFDYQVDDNGTLNTVEIITDVELA